MKGKKLETFWKKNALTFMLLTLLFLVLYFNFYFLAQKEKVVSSSDFLSPNPILRDTVIFRGSLEKTSVNNNSQEINDPITTSTVPFEGCMRTIPNEERTYKHIVRPPSGNVALVCCLTTKGPLNILIHPSWAPIGAENFLNMVRFGFFSSRVPLFRALKHFVVQFGLSSDPAVQKDYEKTYIGGRGGLPDDPSWLPLGPPGRKRNGVERFRKGYLSYAGAGNNSRGTQLFFSFEDNQYLGGGSPWEVPIGQLVGKSSMDVLDSFYTDYGEKPSQGKIRNRGKEYLDQELPLLDYIEQCHIMATDIPWQPPP